MADSGIYYPYNKDTNPTGYKPGTVEEKKAKKYWKENPIQKPADLADPSSSNTQTGAGPWATGFVPSTAGATAMTDEMGNPISDGQLYIYDPKTKKNVITTISDQYAKAFGNIEYLAFIRKQLVQYGQLDPRVKDKTAVLKAFTNALVGASTNNIDLVGYMKKAKELGFGSNATSSGITAGTKTDLFVQNLSSAEITKTIDDTILSTIGRKPTDEERAQFTDLINNMAKKGQTTKTVTDAKGQTKTYRTAGYDPNVAATQIAEKVKTSSVDDYNRQQGLNFFSWMQKAEQARGGI